MKLTPGFRFLLYVLLFIVAALCVILFLCDIGALPLGTISDKLSLGTLEAPQKQLLFLVGLALLFVFSLILFFWSFSKNGAQNGGASLLIFEDENGSTTEITSEALTAVVYRHCMTYRFIAGCIPKVTEKENGGITIKLKLRTVVDTELPALGEKLRASLKETVLNQVGLTVDNIIILFTSAVDKKTVRDNN